MGEFRVYETEDGLVLEYQDNKNDYHYKHTILLPDEFGTYYKKELLSSLERHKEKIRLDYPFKQEK